MQMLYTSLIKINVVDWSRKIYAILFGLNYPLWFYWFWNIKIVYITEYSLFIRGKDRSRKSIDLKKSLLGELFYLSYGILHIVGEFYYEKN